MAKDRNYKKPKASFVPDTRKQVKEAATPAYRDQRVRWKFYQADYEGPWCPKKATPEEARLIVIKLAEFDSRTWKEIEGKQSHEIDVAQLGDDAQERLRKVGHLKARAIETVYSFRLGGAERLWGVRDDDTFCVLWWDPQHLVYPVALKNT